MAQGFNCLCGTPSCRGYIAGAKSMPASQLQGLFLNKHIREMLEERDGLGVVGEGVVVGLKDTKLVTKLEGLAEHTNGNGNTNGAVSETGTHDPTLSALQFSLLQARKLVDSTQKALDIYKSLHSYADSDASSTSDQKGAVRENGVGSRELSGEMGGDTSL
jgi:hypothetical protein